MSARNANVSVSRTARVASVAAIALAVGAFTAQGVRWDGQRPESGTSSVAGVRWDTVAPNGVRWDSVDPNGVRWDTALAGARSAAVIGVQVGPATGVRNDGVRWD